MEGLPNSLMIVMLFVLRLGVPLLITLVIGYALGRLDAKWQAEAEAERQAAAAERRDRPTQPVSQSVGPSGTVRLPGWQPMPVGMKAGPPCWSLKGCTEAMKATCAAAHQPNTPCWAARLNAEGRLPAECKGCSLYTPGIFDPSTMTWTQQEVVH